MSIRRVVSGYDSDGTSVVVSDEQVEGIELLPEYRLYRLWGHDTTPVVPNDGAVPEAPNHWPLPGGHRMLISVKPPGIAFPKAGEYAAEIPGWADHFEDDEPGMHASDTVDLVIVLAGETWCELDDGVEVHLRQGDVFIQNGTRHQWHNRGTETCVTAVILLGAEARR